MVRRGQGRPRAVQRRRSRRHRGRWSSCGFDVFVDLKLLDIPTTVEQAARVVGSLGARYLTLHALGGVAHAAGRRRGLPRAGPARAGLPSPAPHSRSPCSPATPERPPHILPRRGWPLAVEAGCGGLVCAASDLPRGAPAGAAPDHGRARHPPRGRRAPRPGRARHARPGASPPGPICWSSAGRHPGADDPAAAAAAIVGEVTALR